MVPPSASDHSAGVQQEKPASHAWEMATSPNRKSPSAPAPLGETELTKIRKHRVTLEASFGGLTQKEAFARVPQGGRVTLKMCEDSTTTAKRERLPDLHLNKSEHSRVHVWRAAPALKRSPRTPSRLAAGDIRLPRAARALQRRVPQLVHIPPPRSCVALAAGR